jgi:DNA-binding SARP family transcriptional activator
MTSEKDNPELFVDDTGHRVLTENYADLSSRRPISLHSSDHAIEFQVLGPTQARQSGEAISLSGARRRALVTRLVLDAGRGVSAQTLIDDVWGDQPPQAASATLQSHVSQLRKVLGDCLQRTAAGYMISLDVANIDAAEFERKVAGGLSQFAADKPEAAARSLHDALELWRGRALEEVADQMWAQPEAERLEELRNFASEQLLEVRLALGEHERVVPEAKAAVEKNPLREQRWATLMLALYRCGRQAEALRAYQQLRTLLLNELGVDPSPPLAALEGSMLRHDVSLQPPSSGRRNGTGSTPCVEGSLLARAHRAAEERDWKTVCLLLRATDERASLDASDLELLGDAAFMAGEQDVSIAARQRAHALWIGAGDRPRAATAALLIVGNHYVRNRPAIAAGWFHKGRRLLEAEPEGSAHGVLAFTAALISLAQGEPEIAAEAALESQRIGRRFGQADIEAVGLTLHACSLMRLGQLMEAHAMLDEALAWASSGELGPVSSGQIFCWSTQALLAIADFERAVEWVEAIESSGIGGIPGDCRIHRAEALRALGRFGEAQSEATIARVEIQAVDLLHAGIAHYELGMIYLVQHKLDLAEASFRHAEACGAQTQPGIALLELARGHAVTAAESIRAALTEPCRDELRLAPLLSAAAQIFLSVGEDTEAGSVIEQLDGIAKRFGTDGLLATPPLTVSGGTADTAGD